MNKDHLQSVPIDADADASSSTSDSHRDMEDYIEEFESVLAIGDPTDVADFLPEAGHPRFHDITTELLRVDLEHRRLRGGTVSLAEYQRRFSDTLADKSRLQELAFEEFRLCHVAGDPGDPETYAKEYGIDTAGWSELLGDATGDASGQPVISSSRIVAADATDFLKPGQQVFDFKVLCEFGRGAFSKVYLAQQGDLANRFVVLKASREHWDESDILARLQHTNIMPIHSVHHIGELQVVCMPFWGSCTLSDVLAELGDRRSHRSGQALLSTIANHQNETIVSLLKSRDRGTENASSTMIENQIDAEVANGGNARTERSSRSYVDACLMLTADIADALSHAHQRGIVHSDLKPANVLLADDGRPLVLDFNLATRAGHAVEKGVGGTLPYMAPEHLERMKASNQKSSQCASDVFSLGVILFELLTGRKPFPQRDGTFENVIDQLIEDRHKLTPKLSDGGATPVSDSVDSIVRRCLAPDLHDRYASADQLRDDLLAHLNNQPLMHAREPFRQRAAKYLRRNRRHVATAFAVALGVAAILGLAGYAGEVQRNKRLTVAANFNAFARDNEWMTSVLTSPVVGDEAYEQAKTQAGKWISSFEKPLQLPLEESDRHELSAELGELSMALSDAYLEQSTRGTIEERGQAIEQATAWNSKAAEYFVVNPVAVEMQRNVIALAGGAAASSPAIVDGKSPETALGHELLARQLMRAGRLKESLDALQKANSLSPRDYSIWTQLGYAHRALSDFSEAERCFSICVALRPDLAFSYFQRGVIRLESKQHDAAKEDFDRCLDIHPKNVSTLINRALTLKGLGMQQAALSDLDAAAELGATEPRLFLIRSELCHALGDKQSAAELLQKGLESVPADERNWLSRGMAFLRAGDAKQALADFEAAVAANPISINARKNIAHTLSDHLDRLDDAIKVMDDAIGIKPGNAELLASRAVLAARAKQTKLARKDIATALEIKRDVTTLIRAGGVFALTQQNDSDVRQAIEYLRQAMAMNPSWARLIAADPDLEAIRSDKQFQETVAAANTLLK